MTTTIGTRCCATCGRQFTVPANNPRKRYCSSRCRVADWHHRTGPAADRAERPPDNTAPETAVPDNAVAANGVPNTAPPAPRCPHCHQPVAVVTLLVTPTAAHVAPPPAPTP